jgi:hypothetical protein
MNTKVFFTGNLCGISDFSKELNKGHLHLLRSGELTLIDEKGKSELINEPTVLYFPTPHAHRIIGSEENPPKLVCANLIYNESMSNPIANALAALLCFKLSDSQELKQTALCLFEEAFQDQCERIPKINLLTDMFLIHVLRHVLNNNIMQHGLFAGLAHPQLSKV